MLIDTHTHLYVEEFEVDCEKVINDSLHVGIQRFYLPAIDSSYYDKMFALEAKFPENIHLMCGLHPCYVKSETYKEELLFVENQLKSRNFSAIGEIGIDLYWDKTTLAIQQEAFKTQIHWAKKHQLPIIIHSRESFDEIFEILETEKSEELFGIFHCFTGTESQAWKAIELGFALGIGGVVTFKNGKIADFLSRIPLEHIVLETDSPYLAPTPFRGKRNEPKYLKEITEKLATIYQKSYSEIAAITTQNALAVFKNVS